MTGFAGVLRRTLLTLVLVTISALPASAQHSVERAEYRAALSDLYAVRLQRFEGRLEALQDYPLLPYLHYTRLLRYISSATPEDVQRFREQFADTPLADQALLQWLDNLARRGQWETYRQHYDPEIATSTALRCRYYRSLYETGDRQASLAGAARVWVAPESLPDVCDPLFDAWRAHGGPTDEQAWQRINATLAASNSQLATYLVRYLDKEHRALGRDYVNLHRQPERLRRLAAMDGPDERVAEVVAHTIKRLSRRDPATANELWDTWQSRLNLNGTLATAVRAELVRWQLRRDLLPNDYSHSWPPAELATQSNGSLLEELLRNAIGRQDWTEVLGWLEYLTDEQKAESGWRYWRARASLELQGGPAAGSGGLIAVALRDRSGLALSESEALAEFAELASHRNYYGFMAAQRLGLAFELQAQPVNLTDATRDFVAQHPALMRAVELDALGELADKRRELAWLRGRLETDELLALAEIAHAKGWHDQSIHSMTRAQQWHHLELRFPLAFSQAMQDQAAERGLDVAWIYAIARQESAFMTDARSSAGALGVMQVLPATARRTARQLDIPLANTWQLLDHRKNIEIGAGYLAQMYQRYNGNRILAAAAYNAGPGRVDRWLGERGQLPADIWIESIPFRETRHYVQNVLTYTVIYSHRLEREHPFVLRHEQITGADQHSS